VPLRQSLCPGCVEGALVLAGKGHPVDRPTVRVVPAPPEEAPALQVIERVAEVLLSSDAVWPPCHDPYCRLAYPLAATFAGIGRVPRMCPRVKGWGRARGLPDAEDWATAVFFSPASI
jgi:hypothetical protein